MRILTRQIAAITFFGLALAPTALFGVKITRFGDSAPGLTHLADFPPRLAPNMFRRISQWFSDRIGMRYPLIVIGENWEESIWRLRIRRDVFLGIDPWLFLTDSDNAPASGMFDVRGRLRMTGAQVRLLDQKMVELKRRFDACGKTIIYFIAPNKQSIYPQELRRGGSYAWSRLDDVMERVSPDARSLFVEPRRELRAGKWLGKFPVYTKTDSHWNGLGSFIGYHSIVQALGTKIYHPELASLDRYDIVAQPSDGGDIVRNIFFSTKRFADEIVTLRPKSGASFLSEGQSVSQKYENPNGRRKLMILGDSFAPPLAALLANHFSEVVLVDRNLSPKLDGEKVASGNFDVVIVEVVERNLTSLLDGSDNLDRLCSPS